MDDSARRQPPRRGAAARKRLARARTHGANGAWADAFASLSRADGEAPLDAGDLELLATSAYMTGREDDFLDALDRAHKAHAAAGDAPRAARCAFWLGLTLLFKGETGRGTGWLGAARRLVEQHGADCVEAGYLLLPTAEGMLGAKDYDAAHAAAADAAAIGERFADADLVSCAKHVQGRAVIGQGRVEPGLALLDEAMIAVTAGEVSPMMTGLIYCSVIDACQTVHALARAWEWTSALTRWCQDQPQMVAFTGACLVHRAEIMQLRGAWRDALAEARRVSARSGRKDAPSSLGAAYYQQGELHRLRGEFADADAAYRAASRHGCDPQPGLALLRLAEGRTDAAAAAIRRAAGATTEPLARTKLLPACVEITLAADDVAGARDASRELADIAARFDTAALRAMAEQAHGALALAEGDTHAALASLRRAFERWRDLAAPYQAARVRVLIARACRAVGDDEGAALELDAARAVFERLEAIPDLERIDAPAEAGAAARSHRLTPRELEVLRLIAAGETNKAIAAELALSQKTVDRHASNIFDKLGVSSRAAATAYAYRHKLL